MSERPSNNTAGTPRLRVKDKAEPLLPIDKAAERPLWVVLIIMAFLAALALLSARMGERNYGITAVIDDHSEWSDDISRAARAFTLPRNRLCRHSPKLSLSLRKLERRTILSRACL